MNDVDKWRRDVARLRTDQEIDTWLAAVKACPRMQIEVKRSSLEGLRRFLKIWGVMLAVLGIAFLSGATTIAWIWIGGAIAEAVETAWGRGWAAVATLVYGFGPLTLLFAWRYQQFTESRANDR